MTSDWQDVVTAIFADKPQEMPQKSTEAPVITPAPEPYRPISYQDEMWMDKPKRDEFSGEFSMRKALPIMVITCIVLIVFICVATLLPPPEYPCDHYLNSAIKDMPARCFTELMGDKPR